MVINLRTAKALGPFVNPLAKTHLMCCLSGLMSRPKRIHEFIFRTGQGELKEGAARCIHSIASIPPAWKAIEMAARSLGVEPQLLDVRRPEDLEQAFDAAIRHRADALVVGLDTLTQANQRLIVDLAAKHRLPAIYASMEFAGGLVVYGVNYPDLYRRAASFADRIFKGAKPADLPIEQPTKFELVINLKTAKALGLDVPSSLLATADALIE
jgi:putative tryptophan/tyrosine transport system substrate-binding protein